MVFKRLHRLQPFTERAALEENRHPVLPFGLFELLQLLLRQERGDVFFVLHTQGVEHAGTQDHGQQQRCRDLAGREEIIQS